MAKTQSTDSIETRIATWMRNNRRTVMVAAGIVVVLAGGIWFWRTALKNRETFAERALQSARSSAEAGNLALAASDLSRLSNTYGGTRAAQEAVLLLAQIRLLENQATVAATDLRSFIASGPREEFRGPAHGLLGAALEETGQFAEAGQAYRQAAEATPYEAVRAKHLLDAARAFTLAGDTGNATQIYQRVMQDSATGAATIEARIRLSELIRGS